MVACGCNQVWGLAGSVEPRDAAFFDSPPDAPWRCPGLGGTPAFGEHLYQLPIHDCDNFSVAEDGDAAMAVCKAPNETLVYGPPMGEMAPVKFAPPLDAGVAFRTIRLSADGNYAVGIVFDNNLPGVVTVAIERMGAVWHLLGPIMAIPASTGTLLGNPTRGPERHLVTVDIDMMAGGAISLIEFVGDGTSWSRADAMKITDLELTQVFGALGVSGDGLRMTLTAAASGSQISQAYADRDDIHHRFSIPRPIPTAPPTIVDPFVTSDCGRLYFSAVNTVLFVQQ